MLAVYVLLGDDFYAEKYGGERQSRCRTIDTTGKRAELSTRVRYSGDTMNHLAEEGS
jgi:hypothetical protein